MPWVCPGTRSASCRGLETHLLLSLCTHSRAAGSAGRHSSLSKATCLRRHRILIPLLRFFLQRVSHVWHVGCLGSLVLCFRGLPCVAQDALQPSYCGGTPCWPQPKFLQTWLHGPWRGMRPSRVTSPITFHCSGCWSHDLAIIPDRLRWKKIPLFLF